ncbi:MAG: sugar ABC transporter ATP-binding protein [Anaerolineaceae bacterium]|nr:sugar ABC transporter ATP-binding protein [Anaerolineaceae bacterium]
MVAEIRPKPTTWRTTITDLLSNTRVRHLIKMTLIYLVLAVLAFIILIPFAWMLSTALKTREQIFTWPIEWIPNPVQVENFADAVTARPFFLWVRNSLLVSLLSVVGHCISATLVGFSFARLRWRGRNIIFLITLATLMLPEEVTLIPQFLIFQKLGWVNTFLPLFLPTFFGGAFNIFVMRQFMITLPKELDDAARLDGCSHFGVLVRVIVPQVLPAIGFIAINTFRSRWNDFFRPLIYLNHPDLFTLALGLRSYRDEFTVEWSMLMAASLLAILPVVILFFVAQRYFIQGVVFSGVKG